jgi:secreted PhoX family phosphatase
MKTSGKKPAAPAAGKKAFSTLMKRKTLSRRKFMTISAAVGATMLTGALPAAA